MEDYRPIDQQFIDACREYPLNEEKIRELLRQGANLYAVSRTDPDESVMTEIFSGWRTAHETEIPDACRECGHDNSCATCELRLMSSSGKQMVELLQLFISSGLLLAQDGGRAALECIYSITYSIYDRYMFDASKLLVNCGIVGSEDKWAQLLDRVGTEESYIRCCERDHALENIFYALYELLDRGRAGIKQDILVWHDCIGLTIDGIYCEKGEEPYAARSETQKLYFDGKLFLKSGKYAVVLEGSPNIYGCELLADEANNRTQLEDPLSHFIGSTITNICFHDTNVEKETSEFRQPHITIAFDNGLGLHVSTNFGEVPTEESTTFFEIIRI